MLLLSTYRPDADTSVKIPISSGIAGDLFCRIKVSYYLVFTLGIVSICSGKARSVQSWIQELWNLSSGDRDKAGFIFIQRSPPI